MQRFSQVFNIDALFIFGDRSQSTVEAAVLEDPTSEEVSRGNHPHMPRKNRVREDLENAC